ncbi:MAG: DUF255 domain-containing protein [Haloarculaceae archaeon]
MDAAPETNVEWREWGADAFAAAERTGKPLLLSLTVPWSAECREMDRRTYAEPHIAANVNDGFVPVRANADRRPRVRERYTMGGFPSTVFLTPAGEILTGATFLGPDGFRDILDAVRKRWDGRGTAAGSVPRSLSNATPPGGTLDDGVERRMVAQLEAAFDEEFGGWGTDVKFPLAPTVEFALVRAREQATRTLEAIRTHLLDTYGGGFFRYATTRSWGQPRHEKLCDVNAALVRAFAHAYRYTGETAYREAAGSAVEYLTTTLWVDDPPGADASGGAFAASQAGGESYYRQGPTDREDATAPPVDPTPLADRNGLAVDALLTLAAYTDDERARRYATRARAYLVDELVDGDGAVRHDPDVGAPTGLLVDQARVLDALTTAWSVLGDPGPARAVADYAVDALGTDYGAYRDGPTDGPGLLDRPLYPLDTNAALAAGLCDLAALTGEERYRRRAREAVAAFAAASDRMGVEAAGYATVAARLRRPRAVLVGPPAGSDLHRAALRLADHETTVVPETDRAPDGEAALQADGTRRGTAATPPELESLLTDSS